MKEDDKDIIVQRYQNRLNKYGQDIKALASGVKERQRIRFNVLSEVGELNNCSVLDVGCGFADFFQYLIDEGIDVDYTGYDICPDFIEVCKNRYPDADFEVKDIQTDTIQHKFDYVISSQTFNNRLMYDDNESLIKDVIKRAFEISNIGIAIDMLTTYVDFREEHLYYYNPEMIFKFCKSITKRVALRHDYPLFEFAIYMYKDFESWGKNDC